jgi:hypothetical protein
MNLRRPWIAAAVVLAAILAGMLLAGCGGGGEGITTGVTGIIRDVTSGLVIGNVVVTVGAQTGTSRASDGRFTVGPLAPGRYAVVIQPGRIFQGVPGPTVFADVTANRITDVGTLFVIDRNLLPPAP